MSKFYCGCSDFPRDRKKFYETCQAIEYRVGLFTPPKARVLKSWAEEALKAPGGMRSVWVAWQAFTHRPMDIHKGFGLKLLEGESGAHLGHFQRTAENLRVWARIKEQAQNVGATRILLETPANFTPSDANKRALEVFVKEWAEVPEGMKLIWHPAGFWEREESDQLARGLGMVLAVDPLVDEREALPEGEEGYFQMLGRHGLMDSYSDDDLASLLDVASRYDDCTVIFRTRDSLGDARRLIKFAQSYSTESDAFEFDEDVEFFDEEEGTGTEFDDGDEG